MFSPSIISRISPSSRHSQRGAIGLWGSMTLLLAVMFMALAVDTGRLWMQQRKLQSIADIASMEAARSIGCSADTGSVLSAAQAAAARNGYSGQLSQNPNEVELGSVTTVSGIREFSADSEQEAVRVVVTESVPASLVAGGLFGNQVVLNAEAVSAADSPLVAFTAGSFLVDVDEDGANLMNILLGNLLGISLNLNELAYEGLESASLSLSNLLRAQGTGGTVDELLNTEMALGDLLNLISDGVSDAGTAGTLASAALQQLSSGIGNNATLKLADILAVSAPNENGVADVSLNAFSLITAAALFANEGNTVNLSLAGLNAAVTVAQAPLLAVGPSAGDSCAEARTAQLEISVSASLGVASVSLDLAVAPGKAELVEFSDDGSESHVMIAATPGIASIDISATVLGLPVPISSLPIQAATAQELEFDVAHPTADNLPETITVSSPLGDSLENVLQELNVPPLVSTLLGAIGSTLLDPLLEMLGIRLGGMDVTLHGIQLRDPKPLII